MFNSLDYVSKIEQHTSKKKRRKNNKKTTKGPPLPTARDRLTGQEIGGPPTPSKGILTVNFDILTFLHFIFFVFFYSL
jgi:hypothetical protein